MKDEMELIKNLLDVATQLDEAGDKQSAERLRANAEKLVESMRGPASIKPIASEPIELTPLEKIDTLKMFNSPSEAQLMKERRSKDFVDVNKPIMEEMVAAEMSGDEERINELEARKKALINKRLDIK